MGRGDSVWMQNFKFQRNKQFFNQPNGIAKLNKSI